MRQRILCAALLCMIVVPVAQAQARPRSRCATGRTPRACRRLSSLPLNVALRKGFFSREGLNLVVVPIRGGTDRIVAALDKGEIDAGKNATPYLIQAVLKGSDAVSAMAQTTNPVYSLIVRPEIKSFADLKGKTVALSTPGDTITLSTVRLLAAKGITTADFTSKAVVGTPARFDCLKSGECAAVPMGQPEDLKSDQGRVSAAGLHLRGGRRPHLQRRHGASHLGRRRIRTRWCVSCARWPPPTPS